MTSVPSVAAGFLAGHDSAGSYASASPARARTPVDEVDMMRYIGANWPKYRDVWLEQDHDSSQLTISWSFAAFFLTSFWLLYRRQYAIAFASFAVQIAAGYISPSLNTATALATCVFMGMYGKSIVVARGMSAIRNIQSLNMPSELTSRRIEQAGGTSWIAPTLCVVVVMIGAMASGVNTAAKKAAALSMPSDLHATSRSH